MAKTTLTIWCLIIYFLYSSFHVHGQDHKYAIGFGGSYDKYIFHFKPYNYLPDNYGKTDAYSIGLIFQDHFSEKFSFQTGLLYSLKDHNFDWGNTGYLDPPYGVNFTLTNLQTHYLKIPFLINYKYIRQLNFNLNISTGIINELLIGKEEISYYKGYLWGETDFIKHYLAGYLISAQVNLGFEYFIHKKFSISIEPYFNIGLNKIDKERMSSNALSYGLITNIIYHK